MDGWLDGRVEVEVDVVDAEVDPERTPERLRTVVVVGGGDTWVDGVFGQMAIEGVPGGGVVVVVWPRTPWS